MKIDKKIVFIILQFLLSLLFILGQHIFVDFSIVFSFMAFVLNIVITIFYFKKYGLFSNFLPMIIFDVSFYIYNLDLVSVNYQMNLMTKFMILICSAIWKFICFKEEIKYCNNFEKKEKKISKKYFEFIVSLLFAISLFFLLFEWKYAGGIPIFQKNVETFRFSTSYSAITHILAIMIKIIGMLIGIYLIDIGKKEALKHKVLLLELIVSEIMMIFTSMRGEMIFIPVTLLIYYFFTHKIEKKTLYIASLIVLVVVGFLPFYRMYSAYGNSYIVSLINISKYKKLYFLTPLYQTFSNNYSILAFDINIFPNVVNFGFGNYSILPQIPFVNLGKSIGQIQNQVLNNNFYAELTSTYLSSWYADFGYVGFLISTILYSKLLNFSFKLYKKNGTLFSKVWYCYTFYTALWIFYGGTFNIVYIFYSLLIWFITNFKIKY